MIRMVRPVLFSAAVGTGLGAIMTALLWISSDCRQLTNGNECLDHALVVLLIGIPATIVVGLVSLDIGVGGWRGPVITLVGCTVALAGQMLATFYGGGGQQAIWAAAPIGGLAFWCVACAVVQTSPLLVRLAGGAVSLAVCTWTWILINR